MPHIAPSLLLAAAVLLCISAEVRAGDWAEVAPKQSGVDRSTERSKSGAPIYRHEARTKPVAAPAHSARHLEEVEAHVEKHIGKIGSVLHEVVSDLVHIDILVIPATPARPYQVLVTSGVSTAPMKVPKGMEQHNRVELVIALPKDWPLTQESFQREKHYWPVRWLKTVGRLPYEYDTWIGWGHTLPNGDPPEPIANTRFTGVMLTLADALPADFSQLKLKSGKTISFYALMPLYQEEMDLKLDRGAQALEDKFAQQDIGFIVDTGRRNVAKNKGWFR